jgi:hypothetical protein
MGEQHCRVAIIGTGFSGIGTAIRLKQDGIDDVVLLKRAADLGGTWRDNTYPGCACDVPSHLYSFSFAPNPRWPHTFSRHPEIWRYLRDCAERFGILPQFRFGQGRASSDLARGRAALADRDIGRGLDGRGAGLGRGCAERAAAAADTGDRDFRRDGVPLGTMGPRPSSRRPAPRRQPRSIIWYHSAFVHGFRTVTHCSCRDPLSETPSTDGLRASARFVREAKGGLSSPTNRSHVRANTNVSRHLMEMDNAADHVLYRCEKATVRRRRKRRHVHPKSV